MIFDHELVVVGDGPAAISFFNRLKSNNKSAILITTSPHTEPDNIYTRFSKFDSCSPITWKFLNSTSHTIRGFQISSTPNTNEKFNAIEYLGVGGLSNRWGAGCTKLSAQDLGVSSSFHSGISKYYDLAEAQTGIYYHGEDLLDHYLGTFKESALKLNTPTVITFPIKSTQWVKLGRTRQAFLQSENDRRKPCNNCGGCFIYCQNKTIYNARYTLSAKNEEVYTSCKVVKLSKNKEGYSLRLEKDPGLFHDITAKFVVLAAGTMGSTRLMATLIDKSVISSFHHNMIVRTVFFGFRMEKYNNFPSGQYIAKIKIDDERSAYGSLTHGASIPTSDIVDLLPIKNNLIYNLVNYFKKYLVVSLVFYSSEFSNYKIQLGLGKFQFLDVSVSPLFKMHNRFTISRLKEFMRLNRLYTLPFLSTILPQGSDIHYGGSIPIGQSDFINCNENCEINSFPNLYVVDACWMPRVSEKAHTFTIIANAIRVADHVSSRMSVEQ